MIVRWSARGFAAALVLTACVAGCGERHRRVERILARSLGVGLTGSLLFELVECDGPAPDDLSSPPSPCDDRLGIEPVEIAIESSGTEVRIVGTRLGPGPRGEAPAEAVVEGITEGSAQVSVTLDGVGPVRFDITVATVQSSVFLPSDIAATNDFEYVLDHHRFDAAPAFAGSTIFLFQRHYSTEAASGELPPTEFSLEGDAELQLAAGADLGSLTPSPGASLSIAGDLGSIEITSSVGGLLALDVVDATSVASAELRNGDLTAAPPSVTIGQGLGYELRVVPLDVGGALILGDGVEPTVSADSAVVSIGRSFVGGLTYFVTAVAPGTTVVEFDFGSTALQVPVTVE